MPVRPAAVAAARAAPRPRPVTLLARRPSTRATPPCCPAYSTAPSIAPSTAASAAVPPLPPLDPPAAAPVVPVTSAPATTAPPAPPSLPPLPFASQGTRLFSLAGPEPNILPKSIQAALVPPRTCGTVSTSGAAHTSANAPLVPPRRPLSMSSLRTAHADLLFAAADVVIRQARAAQLVARLAHVLPHATAAPADPDVLAALAKCAQVLAQSADALARACPPVLDRAAHLVGAVSNPAALPESLHVVLDDGQTEPAATPAPAAADPALRTALTTARARHDAALADLAAAWRPVRGTVVHDRATVTAVRHLLDDIHATTLGAVLILAQAVASPPPLDQRVDPHALAVRTIHEARAWAVEQFGTAPEVVLRNPASHALPPLPVPAHFARALLSPLRFALASAVLGRATQPVSLLIVQGVEDVTVKITDRGPGLTQRQLADVFHYGLVTAPPAHPKLPPLGFAPPPPERDPVPTPSTPRAGRARRGGAAAAAGSRAVSLVASAAASLLASFRRAAPPPTTAPAPDGPFAAPSPIATASLVATEFTNAEGQLAVPEVAPSIPLQVATRAEPAAPSALGHVLHAHAVALSIARQRVRLFEGDMNVVSMENLGTDTYLHMRYDGAAAAAAGGSKREGKEG
ncbi:hypothetical protein GGF31_006052 [Allomyces arbusculus]|nr:hypothetical protein GGF31_006052 [Allomyces arbusculus]